MCQPGSVAQSGNRFGIDFVAVAAAVAVAVAVAVDVAAAAATTDS